jgi:hypothetical protein
MPDPVYDAFFSHSHHDASCVEDLGRRLTERYGFKVWLDRWALVPGKSWQQDIARGLSETSTCAVCIGNHTPRGWFLQEIERALSIQAANDDYRVIPVLLPDAREDLTEVMPVFLKLRTWADFRKKEDDEYALHVLAQGIRGEPAGPWPPLNEKSNPQNLTLKEIENDLKDLARLKPLLHETVVIEYERRILSRRFP